LAVAFLHILAASPMIMKMLQVFNLFNTPLTATCIAATCLIFALVYVVVFRLTARTYYGIVKW
jgi:putative ABC transport system permease protein